jgi:hypothetical protein
LFWDTVLKPVGSGNLESTAQATAKYPSHPVELRRWTRRKINSPTSTADFIRWVDLVSKRAANMIQAIHRGVEIELEVHQFQHGWKCDYTLIRHPERTRTLHLGNEEFTTEDLAVESALQEAREAIDRAQVSDTAKPR